jgi:hypothetical protein
MQPPAGKSVLLHVDLQDTLARFARILAGNRSPTTVRLYVGVVRRWLAYGGAADRLDTALLFVRWINEAGASPVAPSSL